MTTAERICTREREEWGDVTRECVLSLNIVARNLGVKFGYFFLAGGSLPEVVCNWAGGPPVSAVYEAVVDGVITDLPVLLRRHAAEGELKDLERGEHAVNAMYALNGASALDADLTERELSQTMGAITGISGIQAPQEAEPSRPAEPASEGEPEFSDEELARGVRNFLHYLLGGEDGHDRSGMHAAVEKVYEMLPDEAMDNLCRGVVHAISRSHKYSFPKLKVGLAVIPAQVEGLPQEIYDNLWEGEASPIILVSWQAGPEFSEVVDTCTRRVDAGGLPLLLYRYAKGEPMEVDPLSILRSGKGQGQFKVVRGAQN